jgi:hypothetical protein
MMDQSKSTQWLTLAETAQRTTALPAAVNSVNVHWCAALASARLSTANP